MCGRMPLMGLMIVGHQTRSSVTATTQRRIRQSLRPGRAGRNREHAGGEKMSPTASHRSASDGTSSGLLHRPSIFMSSGCELARKGAKVGHEDQRGDPDDDPDEGKSLRPAVFRNTSKNYRARTGHRLGRHAGLHGPTFAPFLGQFRIRCS